MPEDLLEKQNDDAIAFLFYVVKRVLLAAIRDKINHSKKIEEKIAKNKKKLDFALGADTKKFINKKIDELDQLVTHNNLEELFKSSNTDNGIIKIMLETVTCFVTDKKIHASQYQEEHYKQPTHFSNEDVNQVIELISNVINNINSSSSSESAKLKNIKTIITLFLDKLIPSTSYFLARTSIDKELNHSDFQKKLKKALTFSSEDVKDKFKRTKLKALKNDYKVLQQEQKKLLVEHKQALTDLNVCLNEAVNKDVFGENEKNQLLEKAVSFNTAAEASKKNLVLQKSCLEQKIETLISQKVSIIELMSQLTLIEDQDVDSQKEQEEISTLKRSQNEIEQEIKRSEDANKNSDAQQAALQNTMEQIQSFHDFLKSCDVSKPVINSTLPSTDLLQQSTLALQSFDELERKVTELAADQTATQRKKNDLQQENTKLQKSATECFNKLTELQSEYAQVKESIDTKQTEIQQWKSNVAANRQKLSEWQSTISTLLEKNNDKDNTAAHPELSIENKTITDVENHLESLEKHYNDSLNQINDQHTNIKQTIDKIKEQQETITAIQIKRENSEAHRFIMPLVEDYPQFCLHALTNKNQQAFQPDTDIIVIPEQNKQALQQQLKSFMDQAEKQSTAQTEEIEKLDKCSKRKIQQLSTQQQNSFKKKNNLEKNINDNKLKLEKLSKIINLKKSREIRQSIIDNNKDLEILNNKDSDENAKISATKNSIQLTNQIISKITENKKKIQEFLKNKDNFENVISSIDTSALPENSMPENNKEIANKIREKQSSFNESHKNFESELSTAVSKIIVSNDEATVLSDLFFNLKVEAEDFSEIFSTLQEKLEAQNKLIVDQEKTQNLLITKLESISTEWQALTKSCDELTAQDETNDISTKNFNKIIENAKKKVASLFSKKKQAISTQLSLAKTEKDKYTQIVVQLSQLQQIITSLVNGDDSQAVSDDLNHSEKTQTLQQQTTELDESFKQIISNKIRQQDGGDQLTLKQQAQQFIETYDLIQKDRNKFRNRIKQQQQHINNIKEEFKKNRELLTKLKVDTQAINDNTTITQAEQKLTNIKQQHEILNNQLEKTTSRYQQCKNFNGEAQAPNGEKNIVSPDPEILETVKEMLGAYNTLSEKLTSIITTETTPKKEHTHFLEKFLTEINDKASLLLEKHQTATNNHNTAQQKVNEIEAKITNEISSGSGSAGTDNSSEHPEPPTYETSLLTDEKNTAYNNLEATQNKLISLGDLPTICQEIKNSAEANKKIITENSIIAYLALYKNLKVQRQKLQQYYDNRLWYLGTTNVDKKTSWSQWLRYHFFALFIDTNNLQVISALTENLSQALTLMNDNTQFTNTDADKKLAELTKAKQQIENLHKEAKKNIKNVSKHIFRFAYTSEDEQRLTELKTATSISP